VQSTVSQGLPCGHSFHPFERVRIFADEQHHRGGLIARGRIQAYGTVDASLRLLTEGVAVKAITPDGRRAGYAIP